MVSAQEQAAQQNQALIDAAVENFFATGSFEQGSNEIQTALSSFGVGEKTKQAQQQLSELWNVPTFDAKGNISTVPKTGVIDFSINVGTGKFSQSAYLRSLEELTKSNTSLFSLGAKAFNDVLVTPIVNAFDAIFEWAELSDLSEEQRKEIEAFNQRIAEFEKEIEAFKEEARILRENQKNPATALPPQSYQTRLNAIQVRRAAKEELKQSVEKARKDALFAFRAVRDFTEKVRASAAQMQNMVDKIPFSVHDQTSLQNMIAQASELIEKILREKIEVSQKDITVLQLAMQTAARKIAQPIQETQGILDEILEGLSNPLEGAAQFFSEGIIAFSNIFIKTLTDLFDITPEKITEASEMARQYAVATAQKEKP